MIGLFRFKRDDSRWKLFCVAGISVITLTYLPSYNTKHATGVSQPTPAPNLSSTLPEDSLNQADDILHVVTTQPPPMTTTQIEQARARLIKRGLSPMQADTVLPMGAFPSR